MDKAISKIEEEIRESKKVIKTSDDSRKIASAERSIKNREEKIARLMAGEFNTKSEKAIIEPINFGSASQMTQLLFTDPKGFKFPVVKYTQKIKGIPITLLHQKRYYWNYKKQIKLDLLIHF